MDFDRPPDIVVVAGGQPVPPRLAPRLGSATRVIAADGGFTIARSLGLPVDVAVGDFDSVDAATRSVIDRSVPDIRAFETDKDATDLELALEAAAGAVEAAANRVLVLGLEGGRPDHALANLLVAASSRFSALDIELGLEQGRAWVVHDRLAGDRPAGSLLSVLPVHGAATVSVSGVRWPLRRTALEPGTTRGISNEVVACAVTLEVHAGTALCMTPEP